MKNILRIFLLLFLPMVSAFAQPADVTRFLGIPVDGTREEMIQKIMSKGYRYDRMGDCLYGVLNGEEVRVTIDVKNDKVWRVVALQVRECDEQEAIYRFNKLCKQFKRNPTYMAIADDIEIPEGEQIEHEMTVNNKDYEASFIQRPDVKALLNDSTKHGEEVNDVLRSKYSAEELENPTPMQRHEMIKTLLKDAVDVVGYLMSKHVWFKIERSAPNFYIMILYENVLNNPDAGN